MGVPGQKWPGIFAFFREVLAKHTSDFGVSEGTNETVTSLHLEKQAIVLHTLLFRMIQPVSAHSRAPLSEIRRGKNGTGTGLRRQANVRQNKTIKQQILCGEAEGLFVLEALPYECAVWRRIN